MHESSFLQLILLLNVFLMGIAVTIAARHAYAHFKPHGHERLLPSNQAQTGHLPRNVKEQLLEAAQASYKAILDKSANEFEQELRTTALEIKKLVENLGADVISKELEQYHSRLIELQHQTESDVSEKRKDLAAYEVDIKSKIAAYESALKTKLAEDMAVEKQKLTQQIDTKLADAVASFLTETLQHNVDLGAQSEYLLGVLEAHKADFKQEIADEAPTAK